MTSSTSSGAGWVAVAGLLAIVGAVLAWFEPVAAVAVLAVAVLVVWWLATAGPGGWGLPLVVMVSGAAGFLGWLAMGFMLGVFGTRTPAPPSSITNPLDSAQRAAVLAYAQRLTYADTVCDSHTQHGGAVGYHGQCDRNLVDTLGTIAIVSPEVNIHRSRTADLRRGRIQVRVEIQARPGLDAMQVYDALGVPPGVSYIWVDSLALRGGGGTARAIVVPVDSRLPARAKAVEVYPAGRWSLAAARWTPGQCWSCKSSEWCSTR